MSSDEESYSGSDSEEEVETKSYRRDEYEKEYAMKKRREAQTQNSAGLDDAAKELLAYNRQDRDRMEDEIQELRQRTERRKREREIEEKRLTAERAAEDERRKAAEETKRKQKYEEEEKKQKERAKKLAELEKMRNPPKPNFVIKKKSGSDSESEEEEDEIDDITKNKKSKQQLEAEKQAILSQRVKPLEINGFNSSKLTEKAKDLHTIIYKLEGEKYDLEKHFKAQQFDMMELAERARQINKVGKGGLKRIQAGPDDPVDKIQEKFAGTPAKIEMYSKYERQKDKRDYVERVNMFQGPQFSYPAERIRPKKNVAWDDERMPVYSCPSNGHHDSDK